MKSVLIIIILFSCKTNYVLTANIKSNDSDYGFSSTKPIKVGGFRDETGSNNQWIYLSKLKTYKKNEILTIYRIGSCCMFKTSNGMFGKGLLDKYAIITKFDTVMLFLNLYDYEMPKTPMFFNE